MFPESQHSPLGPNDSRNSRRVRLRQELRWAVHVGFWLVLATGVAMHLHGEPAGQWLPAQVWYPLGTDEFGRDILSTSLTAAAASLLKGALIAMVTMTLALCVAVLSMLRSRRYVEPVTVAVAAVVESIPSVLWVLIVLVVVREPRLLVVGAAFCLVVLPGATRVIAGELSRLRAQPFVEAAYQLGAGELRVLFRYILPNAGAVLLPYGLQILGGAIAVDGAIGVIGLGNRSDLDLGIFLLRGKESFVLHPQLLLVALCMYALIYGYLMFWSRHQLASEQVARG